MKHFWAVLLSLALASSAVAPPLVAAALLCAPGDGAGARDDVSASASTCCCPPGSGARCQTDSGRGSGPATDCCEIAPAPRANPGVVPAVAPAPTLSRVHGPLEVGSTLSPLAAAHSPESSSCDTASPPPSAARPRHALLSILLI